MQSELASGCPFGNLIVFGSVVKKDIGSMADETLEIVVSATRIDNAALAPNWSAYVGIWDERGRPDQPWIHGPFSTIIQDKTSPTDPKRQLINSVIETFNDQLTQFKEILQSLSPNTNISIGDGRFITASALLGKLNSIQKIEVTGRTYAPGYGGKTFEDRIEIHYKTIAYYVVHGQEGLNFLILHELAHNTETGIIARSKQFNTYLDLNPSDIEGVGYKAGNPQFEQQERYTNLIAKEMARTAGIAIPSPLNFPNFPPFGYASEF